MQRLYFLMPDQPTARKIVDELLLSRIECRRMHVAARQDMDLEGLPEATVVQVSDLVPALGRGLIYGGLTGLGVGVVVAVLFGLGFGETGGLLTLAIVLAGAGLGAWFSSLVGISVPSSRLEHFRQAVEDGNLLMMVDAPAGRVDEIRQRIARHHPEVQFGGVEPGMPAFP